MKRVCEVCGDEFEVDPLNPSRVCGGLDCARQLVEKRLWQFGERGRSGNVVVCFFRRLFGENFWS